MTFTPRKKEFLIKINHLCEKDNTPIHYVEVAEQIGVSKWSAYEMMKNLEKAGWLTSEYRVNPDEKNPGRSRIVFSLTSKAHDIISINEPEILFSEKWYQSQEYLLSNLKNLKEFEYQKNIDDLLEQLKLIKTPLIFNAYVITIMIIYLFKAFGSKSFEIIKKIVNNMPQPEIGLNMLIGTVIGDILKTNTLHFIDQLSEVQQNVYELSSESKKLLMNFFEEALKISYVMETS